MEAEKELLRRFYRGFWSFIITWTVAFTIAISLIIAFLVYFFQGETKIGLIMSGVVFLAIGIIFVVGGAPYFRDLPAVKHKKIEVINGIVIKYNKIKHGGDFTTYSYLPVVKDGITGEEVELVMLKENMTRQSLLGKRHIFIYLQHTKLAVIKKDG